ncbi:Actin-like protein ARP9 [Candida viswanathii]|uniref:Actin-like protein ARP9 n=1 Tax=Candida viswanathii TaxID=5486 RepID=A0A367YJB8_9ASCO|nr:Actin-like protein ARP9 [Candida viswanathii]
MPLYKEDNFLIIYPSSKTTVFSFGLSDSLSPPQFKIPSIVYQNTTTKEYQSTPNEQTIEIYPIVQNKIVDLDAFNHLLKIILQSIINKHPTITINQIPMLLIIPSLTWSRNALEYITKYVIEILEITAFNIVDLSLAATFGAGQLTNSTVVYVDHESIQVVPVVGYQAIKFAGKLINGEGGVTIDRELKKFLPNLSDSQLDDFKDSGIYEVLIDQNEQSGLDEVQEFDVAKIVTDENGKAIDEVDKEEVDASKANRELEKNFFIDSQTQEKIWVGKERFSGTSPLVKLISKSIYASLLLIPDIDRRQDCYDNIILVGSVFKIPGLKEAVLLKLTQDYLVTEPTAHDQELESQSGVNAAIMKYQQADEVNDGENQQSNTSQVPNLIKLAKFADYFPEWKKPKEFGGSWQDVYFLGGQIYSKQIFSGSSHHHGKELFVGSDMYEERGPQSIWDASI